MHTIILSLLLLLVATALGSGHDDVKDLHLMQLFVLNRHGHRSPNRPYWKMCPNDAYNRKSYDVVAGQLTSVGFREELEQGKWLNKNYGDFIGQRYDPRHHYFRAVAEPRTMQSAMIAAQGVFPEGFGPEGILPSRPQYPPIFSDLESHEYLLDDLRCIPNIRRDVAQYMKTTGNAIVNEPENAAALKEIRKLCGTPKEFDKINVDLLVKIMVDGVVFNHDFGINVVNGKVSEKLLFRLRNISNVLLQGKLYGTDEQKTYAAVNFPRELLHSFRLAKENPAVDSTVKDSGVPTWKTYNRFTYYCGHREELYGTAYFFKMSFRVPGYPPMELPAGSSYIFSLYNGTDSHSHKTQYYVKSTLWTPNHGTFNLPSRGCANAHLCTLDEFIKMYEVRTKRTGTWDKICEYTIPPQDRIGKRKL